MADHEHGEHEDEGASVKEILIEACRRNNTELLAEALKGLPDDEISKLLNETTTVMGNHLYHEAASRGHYEIIDMLLDQPNFECDPVNRADGDTPLHSIVRWINAEPAAQREFGNSIVEMMLEAGSNTRARNRGRLTPLQLVDPRNPGLRELIQAHEYTALNAGDFVPPVEVKQQKKGGEANAADGDGGGRGEGGAEGESEDEFSGSDDDDRAEWERQRRQRQENGGR